MPGTRWDIGLNPFLINASKPIMYQTSLRGKSLSDMVAIAHKRLTEKTIQATVNDVKKAFVQFFQYALWSTILEDDLKC